MIDAPNLSPGFLSWVGNNDFRDKTILEIGSGFSTIFFTDHFNFVYSFEDDADWFVKIKDLAEEKSINNLELSMFDIESIKKSNFIELISVADVFLIDNNPTHISRSMFAQIIDSHKKEESIIVLDNGTWNMDAYRILRENYYCMDFPYERESGEKTETSVFFKKIERINREKLII